MASASDPQGSERQEYGGGNAVTLSPWISATAGGMNRGDITMTGHVARVNGARANISPAIGSAWLSHRPGQPKPMDAGAFALVTLPTSPFWARRYTRVFLDSCRGISADTAETAELIVSELVTTAVRFAGDPARTLRYSERANASLISLSLRHFHGCLLIEVYDADSNPPIRSLADDHAENGRGLMLVDALSKEWSYFFPPGVGKVVYCFLEILTPPKKGPRNEQRYRAEHHEEHDG